MSASTTTSSALPSTTGSEACAVGATAGAAGCATRAPRSAGWIAGSASRAVTRADADEARAIGATCGGVRVWSLYVPNGRTLEDPHLPYKLKWLSALRDTATGWLADDPSLPLALMGDWNIAPTDEDVWDMAEFQNSTHVSEPERKAFNAIIDTRFTDVVRPYTPGPGVYTYWDYTQLAFQKRRGMRIDFILGSPGLARRVVHAEIVKDERRPGKKGDPSPSDHAPVLVDLRR